MFVFDSELLKTEFLSRQRQFSPIWHWLSFSLGEASQWSGNWTLQSECFSSLSADGAKWRQQATLHCQLPPTSIWLAANDACVWLLYGTKVLLNLFICVCTCVGETHRVENWHAVFYIFRLIKCLTALTSRELLWTRLYAWNSFSVHLNPLVVKKTHHTRISLLCGALFY